MMSQLCQQTISIDITYFTPLKLRGGGFLFLKFAQRGGHEKTAQKQRGQLKEGVLLERLGFPNCFISFPSEKHVFITTGFFCLVNIHTCCNQQIYSFMWFSFYQKMIYYEISFPLTLIFNYNFVKISLLMTFISISISLKTSNIFENKSQVFERSD